MGDDIPAKPILALMSNLDLNIVLSETTDRVG